LQTQTINSNVKLILLFLNESLLNENLIITLLHRYKRKNLLFVFFFDRRVCRKDRIFFWKYVVCTPLTDTLFFKIFNMFDRIKLIKVKSKNILL